MLALERETSSCLRSPQHSMFCKMQRFLNTLSHIIIQDRDLSSTGWIEDAMQKGKNTKRKQGRINKISNLVDAIRPQRQIDKTSNVRIPVRLSQINQVSNVKIQKRRNVKLIKFQTKEIKKRVKMLHKVRIFN